MLNMYKVRPAAAAWLAGLVLTSLCVAACGSASSETSEAPTPAEVEEEATAAQAEESETEAAGSEEAAAVSEEAAGEESEASDNETLLAPDQPLSSGGVASCTSATPQNDPLVAALQPNDQIAAVSEADWAKGPSDAAVTLVEYGDFQ